MKIIIEVKDTATLEAIEYLDKDLTAWKVNRYSEVIKSISKEW